MPEQRGHKLLTNFSIFTFLSTTKTKKGTSFNTLPWKDTSVLTSVNSVNTGRHLHSFRIKHPGHYREKHLGYYNQALASPTQICAWNIVYNRYDGRFVFPDKIALPSIQESPSDTLYRHTLSVYLCLGIHVCPLVYEDFSHIHSVFLSSQMERGQATLQRFKVQSPYRRECSTHRHVWDTLYEF